MFEHMSHAGVSTNLSHILHLRCHVVHPPTDTHSLIGLIQHIIIHNRRRPRYSTHVPLVQRLFVRTYVRVFVTGNINHGASAGVSMSVISKGGGVLLTTHNALAVNKQFAIAQGG